MFEGVRIVIFCVALSDYNEYCKDASGISVNRMMERKRLFESIIIHPTFEQMDFLLILNKFDLLEQKIESSPLAQCDWFTDFNPVSSRHCPKAITTEAMAGTIMVMPQRLSRPFTMLLSSSRGYLLLLPEENCMLLQQKDWNKSLLILHFRMPEIF